MKTVEFSGKVYVVEGAIDAPAGAIFLETLSSDELVALRNLLTSNLDLGRDIKMFQSKAKGINLVTALLIKFEDTDFSDELPEEMQPDPLPAAKPEAVRTISADDLLAHDFEEEDLSIVKAEWPDGIPATEASVTRAFALGMDGGIFKKAFAAPPSVPTGKVRDGSKQAALIDLLKRPEGASINEIAEALEWLKHTVRGAISRDVKKRLGLPVTKSKVEGRGQVYRIES